MISYGVKDQASIPCPIDTGGSFPQSLEIYHSPLTFISTSHIHFQGTVLGATGMVNQDTVSPLLQDISDRFLSSNNFYRLIIFVFFESIFR